MRENSKPALQASATRTVSVFPGQSLLGCGPAHEMSWFLLFHLDYFIVHPDSQSLPGPGITGLFHRAPRLFSRLPVPIAMGFAKTTPPRHGRQLTKPPGRYGQV